MKYRLTIDAELNKDYVICAKDKENAEKKAIEIFKRDYPEIVPLIDEKEIYVRFNER